MPKKENRKLIDASLVTAVIVKVQFEIDADGNLEGAMSTADAILNHISGKSEVTDTQMSIEVDMNGV